MRIGGTTDYFDFERLRVYQSALEFADFIFILCKNLPAGYQSSLADQLRRSVVSIANNIAEGAGKVSRREKIRYYTYALDATKECIPAMTIAHRRGELDDGRYEKGREYCNSICRMMSKLIKSVEDVELSKVKEEDLNELYVETINHKPFVRPHRPEA